MPEFIRDMEARGEWQGSTRINYARRLSGYVYDFHLEDGRTLGDVPLNQITETMIGAVLDRARTSGAGGKKGKSLATQDQIGSPLRRFFREMIRKQAFRAADAGWFLVQGGVVAATPRSGVPTLRSKATRVPSAAALR